MEMGASQYGELMLGVAVMGPNPLQDVPGAAQQLLGEVGRHLGLEPVHLHLLSTACICQSLQQSDDLKAVFATCHEVSSV